MLWSWLLVTLGHTPLLAGGWLSNHLIIIIHGSISLVCVPRPATSVHSVAYLIISAGKLGKSGNVKCTQIVIVFLLLIESCDRFQGQPQPPQTIPIPFLTVQTSRHVRDILHVKCSSGRRCLNIVLSLPNILLHSPLSQLGLGDQNNPDNLLFASKYFISRDYSVMSRQIIRSHKSPITVTLISVASCSLNDHHQATSTASVSVCPCKMSTSLITWRWRCFHSINCNNDFAFTDFYYLLC